MCEEAAVQIQSIDDCISVLQGDLHQPGTPAIVLKLAASWQKVKKALLSGSSKPLEAERSVEERCRVEVGELDNGETESSVTGTGRGAEALSVPTTDSQAVREDQVSTSLPPAESDSSTGQDLAQQLQTQSSGLLIKTI